jgi:hypothetical protein
MLMARSAKPPDILRAIRDRRLIGDRKLSPAQETALRALYGLPLSDEQFDIFCRATGRESYEPAEYREASFICGRRSGKSSKLAANIAVFEAAFRRHELAEGERGYVVALAPTRRQAAVVFQYVLARLEGSPTLRRLIDGEPRADEIDMTNGITIAVWPANFRTIRGISIVCAVCDEIAFWQDDATGANPASEVLRAIRPAMASFEKAKLVKISSPFAKSGVVWDDWNERATHSEMLVWKLDTATMNPSLSRRFLAEEERRDPESFAREYGAEFYESASALLPAEAVQACVQAGRCELLPNPGTSYNAALDAAFRGDAFAFALVHREGEKVVQDVTRSWRGSRTRPVNLAETLTEIVATLRAYGVSRIFGDQFCSEPIKQALAARGIEFIQTTTLGSRASGIWASLRTIVTSGQIELLDDAETVAELKRLELIVTRGGNQRVEASTGHDDRAVALALAAHQAVSQPAYEPHVHVLTFDQNGRSSEPGFVREDGTVTGDGPERWWNPI